MKLNKVNIAITNEKLNKEDMARLLGRGGVGDFGGCVAKKKSFTSAIPLGPRCINFNSSGAGQKYFSSYQLCWEDNYLSAVDWERCTLPTQHQHHYQPNHQYHCHHHHFHLQLNKNKITIFKVAPDECHTSQFL